MRHVGQRLAHGILECCADVCDWGIIHRTLIGNQHAQPQRTNCHCGRQLYPYVLRIGRRRNGRQRVAEGMLLTKGETGLTKGRLLTREGWLTSIGGLWIRELTVDQDWWALVRKGWCGQLRTEGGTTNNPNMDRIRNGMTRGVSGGGGTGKRKEMGDG